MFISSILCNFGGKIHTIRIKLVEFDWKKAFIKAEKSLDITLFLVQLKFILSKPGLKKARKASQFSKRSSKELLYLQRAPFGVFFFIDIL